MKTPKYLRTKTAKGKRYLYFELGTLNEHGKPILKRLPDINDPGFGRALAMAQTMRQRRASTGASNGLYSCAGCFGERGGAEMGEEAVSVIEFLRRMSPTSIREDRLLLTELRSLAVSLHRQHYWEVKQWRPLPDARGILSQIDNMVAGLEKPEQRGNCDNFSEN